MFRISVFVFTAFIMLVTAFSFGVGWNVVRFRKPSRFLRLFVIVFRFVILAWLIVLYGFSVFLFFRAEELDPMLIFILFAFSAIVFILTLAGNLNDPVDRPIVRPLLSRKVARICKRVFVGWFVLMMIWVASSFLVFSTNDARAERLSFENMSSEAFAIDYETVVFADEDFVYLMSNDANGVSIYHHDKTYVGTYYFTPRQNGRAEFFVWRDRLFVHSKIGTIFAYGDGTFQGRLEFDYEGESDTVTAWDDEGNLLYRLTLDSSQGIVAFDREFVYIERFDGSFRTDGVTTLPWNADYETATGMATWEDLEYTIRDNRLLQNQEVFLATGLLTFISTHFAWGWCFGLTMIFAFVSFRKVSKLEQLGNEDDVKKNDQTQA